MSEQTYPYGYGTGRYTMAQLRARYEPNMHPEFARRLFRWIKHRGGSIGIGGGFRPLGTQPDRPGFAPEGRSFHQPQRWASGIVAYAAVDLVVGVPAGKHRAPTWAEVDDVDRFGLNTPVPREPWHVQPVPVRGHTLWVSNGRRDPVSTEVHPVAPPKPAPWPTFNPHLGLWSLWPLGAKPVVRSGASGDIVKYLQGVIFHKAGGGVTIDGQFGEQTERRVKDVQKFFGKTVDGVVGRQTWGIIDFLAGP